MEVRAPSETRRPGEESSGQGRCREDGVAEDRLASGREEREEARVRTGPQQQAREEPEKALGLKSYPFDKLDFTLLPHSS